MKQRIDRIEPYSPSRIRDKNKYLDNLDDELGKNKDEQHMRNIRRN